MKNPYRIVNRALRDAKSLGNQVTSCEWGLTTWSDSQGNTRFCIKDACACPLGLALAGKKTGGANAVVAACRLLGVPKDWVRSFMSGVDGGSNATDKRAFNFGRRIRSKVYNGNG